MAEQSSRDVVDQTLSGGEPSLSDVPASTKDKQPAGGDVEEAKHIATTSTAQIPTDQPAKEPSDTLDFQADKTGRDKDAGASSMVGGHCSEVDDRIAELESGFSETKRRTGRFQSP